MTRLNPIGFWRKKIVSSPPPVCGIRFILWPIPCRNTGLHDYLMLVRIIVDNFKEDLRYHSRFHFARVSGRVSDEHRDTLATDKMTQRLFGGISPPHKKIGLAALSLPLVWRSSSGSSPMRRNIGSSVVMLLSIESSSPVPLGFEPHND